MPYKFSNRSRIKLESVKPDLQKVFNNAIIESPFDFGITHGYRSTEEQKELYAKGRTKEGKIVTYVDGVHKKSRHQFREAVDIVCYNGGKVTWDHKYYSEVAEHIKKIAKLVGVEIEWGGDWKRFKDYPHFQLKR